MFIYSILNLFFGTYKILSGIFLLFLVANYFTYVFNGVGKLDNEELTNDLNIP
jgi:hypothetical protein